MAPVPILTTKRLTLRPLSVSDTQEIFLLRSDPAINKYLGREPSQTPADALHFINKIVQNGSLYWAVTKTDNPQLIGTICLFDLSNEQKKCEIGYELLTDYQGQGIMNEAATSVIEFAFQTLGLTTIDACSHKNNQSSMKLLQQLNFEKTAIVDETNPDMIVFRLSSK